MSAHADGEPMGSPKGLLIVTSSSRRTRFAAPWFLLVHTWRFKEGRNVAAHADDQPMASPKGLFIVTSSSRRTRFAAPWFFYPAALRLSCQPRGPRLYSGL